MASGLKWVLTGLYSGSDQISGGLHSTWGFVFIETCSCEKQMDQDSHIGFIIHKLCVLGTSFALSEPWLPYLQTVHMGIGERRSK